MRRFLGFSKISRLAGAVAALWLLCAGPAWAGGGGMDAEGLQSFLCGLLGGVGVGLPQSACPQYPTYATTTASGTTPYSPITPIVLEVAAWVNTSPDDVRSVIDSDCLSILSLGIVPPNTPYCPQVAVNAANGPVKSPLSDPTGALPSLNALAFVSNPGSAVPLTVVQNLASNATSYASAVVEGPNGQPNTIDLFFTNPTRTDPKGLKGQVVAAITFPLAVLVNGAAVENSVLATLQVTATCNGAAACFSANVLVDLSGGTNPKLYSAAALGISFAYYSSPSPTYEVQIPLLVNTKTDPFYFVGTSLPGCPNTGISAGNTAIPNLANIFSGYCNAFSANSAPGFAPTSLTNTVVGMAPSAAPQCTGNPPAPGTPGQPGAPCPTTLPSKPPQPLSPTFGFCAFLSNTAYVSNTPDAAFYLAIGTDGTTYVSSPVNPALSGAPYPACPTS